MITLDDNEICPDCDHKGHMHFRKSARKKGGCYAQIKVESIYERRCPCKNYRVELEDKKV